MDHQVSIKIFCNENLNSVGLLFAGTGKTLLAAALAKEINRENLGKVSFFHRKGADCLDKWLGESEKKLKDLFDKVLFFLILLIENFILSHHSGQNSSYF